MNSKKTFMSFVFGSKYQITREESLVTYVCWKVIYKVVMDELDRICPLKTRKVRQSNEPWLTNKILEAIYDKDQAWKLAKRTGDSDDIGNARRLRNNVKDIIRRAKRDFIQEELLRDETATKNFLGEQGPADMPGERWQK